MDGGIPPPAPGNIVASFMKTFMISGSLWYLTMLLGLEEQSITACWILGFWNAIASSGSPMSFWMASCGVMPMAANCSCTSGEYGNLPAIRALLQSGVDVDEHIGWYGHNKNNSALWIASQYGDAAVVKELIEAGADVNVRASSKSNISGVIVSDVSPLFIAAHSGHTPVVIELIKAGADVNVPRSDGTTPLHMAASKGHEACVVLLIQAGADVNAKAQKPGWTPLSVAIEFKHEKVVKLLKHFGAR